jgi:serine/threonine protein kinase
MSVRRIGRYEIECSLGSGGMGEVYRAYDPQLRRCVAVKGLHHDKAGAERRERLRREALSVAALSHPAIAHVHEIVTEGEQDWVVMEYIDGSSLADLVTAGPLAPAEVARVGSVIAEALADAHRHGIIHRDVKPENVMVTSTGHVKVLDFGLAKWTGARASEGDPITVEGMVVGTSKAMSPEQALGRPLDARSDVFSLGSLLYEIASGRPAFRGTTPMDTMYKVSRGERTPLAELVPGLPAALVAVIEKCLAMRPSERYQSADELSRVLHGLAGTGPDLSTAGRPAGLIGRLSRLLRRRGSTR